MRIQPFLIALLPALTWALPAAVPLLPEGGVFALEVGNTEMGGATRQPAEHADFKESLVLETRGAPGNVWDVQAQTKAVAPVEAGDVLLATFWVRAVKSLAESGEARTMFVFELARDPWEKSVEYPVRAGKDWRQFFVPFKASRGFAVGEASIILRMGYEPQKIEVGGLTVVDYGKAVALEDLPVTKLSYQGREADAPWRKAAQERIDKIRVGALWVRVRDAQGRPVEGAVVSLKQTRNAFHFGSAISGNYLFGRSRGGDGRYAEEIKRLFNTVTEENAWKWPSLAGDWGRDGWGMDTALQSLIFAHENGLRFRGHVLFWPSWRNSPKSLRDLEHDKAGLRAEILAHIRELVKASKPMAGEWDVVNEPFDNHEITDILGEGILGEAFREAYKTDPKVQYFINDYAILPGGGGDSGHRRFYEQSIRKLLRTGAPLKGIGLQGHFGSNLTGMDDALTILDRFGALGPKMSITEYDIDLDDMGLAGDYTRDILTLAYSHPAMQGFVTWGFWDGAHWHADAPFYTKDWRPKAPLKAWEDLVLGQWKTQATGTSDAQGRFGARVHLGDYAVTVRSNGKERTVRAQLTKPESQWVDVKF